MGPLIGCIDAVDQLCKRMSWSGVRRASRRAKPVYAIILLRMNAMRFVR